MDLEHAAPEDRYADYCLWDYPPVTPPAGKLRCANLLWRAIDASGGGPHLKAACMALREKLGPFRTVFGVKKIAGRLSYEFYFYDYARLERDVSITRILKSCRPSWTCPLQLLGRPALLYVLDRSRRGHHQPDGGRSTPSTSMSAIPAVPSLRAFATSFRRPACVSLIFIFSSMPARKWTRSPRKWPVPSHHDLRGLPISAILRPELLDCEVVVVANKKFNDGIYFSQIKIDPLIEFLERESFPAELVAFAKEHRNGLDHMLYDVGIDYAVEGGAVKVLKTAFYGLL